MAKANACKAMDMQYAIAYHKARPLDGIAQGAIGHDYGH